MDTLPNYIKGFDVCINPQVLNEITIDTELLNEH